MTEEMIEKIGNRMATLGNMINISHRDSKEMNKFDHEFNGMVQLLKAADIQIEITREIDNIRQIDSIKIEGLRFFCEAF